MPHLAPDGKHFFAEGRLPVLSGSQLLVQVLCCSEGLLQRPLQGGSVGCSSGCLLLQLCLHLHQYQYEGNSEPRYGITCW